MFRSLFVGSALAVCLAASVHVVQAQVDIDEHKAEVGGLYTIMSLKDFDERFGLIPGSGGDHGISGVGGRFGYNFHKYVALDAEVNFFPESHLLNEEFGQKMQGFIGVKAGVRKNNVGIFAKARPGVMWFGDFSSRGSCSPTTFGSVCGVAHEKDVALDVGGVFEYYPTDRLIMRADVGDTIIRYQSRQSVFGITPRLVPAATKHNVQLSFGIGWRF